MTHSDDPVPGRFDDVARAAVYRVMELRRDVRKFARGDLGEVAAVDDATIDRILRAAQLAPSVGFSQPWGFVVIRSAATRALVRESFVRCRQAEASKFDGARREKYLAYKLEGIEESALNVCVVADLRPRDEAILGATVQPEAVRASVCCAVENLWLAARAEGLGVGWVSIVEPSVLRNALDLPAGVEPIAYLCIGHPEEHRARPLLEETGWLERRSAHDAVHRERWPHVESAPVEAKPRAPTVATPAIAPIDADAIEASRAHQRTLTKPAGSLGRLEDVAAWYAGVHGRFPPPPPTIARVAVFAGDHGVTVEGVSAYPSSVTAAMVANVMSGGAAIACMAKRVGVEIALVDVGVAGDLTGVPRDATTPLTRANVRAGTRNLRVEAAMTIDEARAAIGVGAKIANQADYEGVALAGVGEIGIGNTTSAAALICALTGSRPEDVVGSGTGIDDAIRARKVRVVTDALARDPRRDDPLEILASFGGLEIAAMVGFLLEAARLRLPVVLDGFLANAAALVARAIDPRVVDHLLASHASAERGSTIALATLGLKPLLDLEMRLGEGTGALLAIELVRTAVHAQLSMATFATAGIVGRAGL